MDWARAYGLIRDSGSDPHAVSLIGERTLAAAGTAARPAERFAGVRWWLRPGARWTYPPIPRHVIVVKHAGERQTFSVHEVAHNHVEWVGGQGHYKLGYAST